MSEIRRTRVEDYLTAIEQVCEESATERASTGTVAKLLKVSNGTVSSMAKQLAKDGLIDHLPYEGVSLTAKGTQQARRVLRRRRLIELFLSRTLNVTWESVADEAWQLELTASVELIRLMDQYLEHPQFDPHGDPIPSEDGSLPQSNSIPLTACHVGDNVTLHRVKNQSESVLRFLRKAGLGAGTPMQVKENSPASGVVELILASGNQTLGYQVAEQIFVLPQTDNV